ncbi:GntR family transcriptional regulator [Microbacterium ulmi]|uniref:GntR family transcriptional regulator n=1 Tax=Microbacterium ulmi TaxID=179095 RepID=A0A7Y2Q1R2_9MICO|nr:GntR family transcriptional regulator [Microbacterium ulmi]NII69968.1 DNA-binding GntR family transcriptional regulator [Microbacterium ulmi]NNH04602.1 GntR family transcriptional regulator [Microbacterium ulmi]
MDQLPAGATGRLIADRLREQILDGRLTPGTRIGQDAVAAEFRSSRIPVREALRLLEAEGLISIRPNAGAWVARLDATEFDQIYRLREQVEPLAIQESIPHLAPAQLERLHELVEELETSSDVEQFLASDRAFHLLTYAGARLPLLHDLVDRFWNSTQHYRRAWVKTRPLHDWTTDAEHRLIVDAIERRDLLSAADLVSGHIRRTRLALAARPDLFTS